MSCDQSVLNRKPLDAGSCPYCLKKCSVCALCPAGQLPALGPPQVYSEQVDHKFTSALNAAKMIMAGEQ